MKRTMSLETTSPRAVVSAIIEKTENGKKYIFLQTRWKPQASSSYLGALEIPAGGVDCYENVYDAIKREVEEETGLTITRFIDDEHTDVMYTTPKDASIAFKPFICQQTLETDGGLPWVGFVFRCEAVGEICMDPSEAKDPQWVLVEDLRDMLAKTPDKFFSLQLATLRYYVDKVSS